MAKIEEVPISDLATWRQWVAERREYAEQIMNNAIAQCSKGIVATCERVTGGDRVKLTV